MAEGYPSPVSRDDIASLARKLDEWGTSLPPQERALLELIVSRARLVQPDDLFAAQLGESVERATKAAFEDLSSAWEMAIDYWDKIGPIWQKANPVELGDELEFTTRFVYRRR